MIDQNCFLKEAETEISFRDIPVHISNSIKGTEVRFATILTSQEM